MKEKRLGRFIVTDELIAGAKYGEGVNLFHGFIPLDVKHSIVSGTVEYIGWHKDFNIIKEGEIAPIYICHLQSDDTHPTWVLGK